MATDIISNSKIFIDFGGSAAGLPGGAFQLQRVKDIKVKDDRKTEVVKAVGVQGGAGYRDEEGGGTISLTVLREVRPEVDYRQLKRDKRTFIITMQDESGGGRERFLGCRVSNVGRGADDSGNHMDEVEIVFLRTDNS